MPSTDAVEHAEELALGALAAVAGAVLGDQQQFEGDPWIPGLDPDVRAARLEVLQGADAVDDDVRHPSPELGPELPERVDRSGSRRWSALHHRSAWNQRPQLRVLLDQEGVEPGHL